MPKYVLGHHLKGEGARLALMSELLDPMHRRYIDALGVVRPGARTLEVGFGNGSISAWLAERVSPGGTALAVDLDLSLIHVRMPNLELRRADIVADPVERGAFDLVTARAVLHHVADAQAAIANMVAGLKPGGALLLIEPDFFQSVLLNLQRRVRSGTVGLRGRANGKLITTLGAHLRLDWRQLA
jgi:2-polyprenyl-3-methyl-5-hydroxy-6-metoxy-1,4-benzoquinol methylase